MPTPIIITETYTDAAGNPAGAGSRVLFLLTVPLTDSTTGARVPATTLTALLDNQGRLLDPDTLQPGAILFATDDPTTLPTGAAYRVEERIAGQETRIYYITVPYNAPSGTIALGRLVPGDTAPPVTYALQSVQMPAPFVVTRHAGIDVVTYDFTGASVGDVQTVLSLAPDVVGFAPPTGGGAALADTDPRPLADPPDPGTAATASRADHTHPRDGGMRWRGEWDAATAYAAGDSVLFVLEGEDLAASFVAVQAATGADQDPNHDDYWTYFAYAVLPTVADGISVSVPNAQYIRLNGGTLIDNGGGQAEYTPTPPPALADDPPAPLGSANPGTSPDVSRSDHDHGLPTLGDLGAASAADLLTEANTARAAEAALGGLISAEASTARGAESALTTALGGKASTSHASSHITGGSDIIPNAVAGGASGLLSGVLATRLGQFVPASGKTFTVSNSLTLAGTDGDTATLPSGGGTLAVRGSDNAFTVGQGVRGALSGAAGLAVPWIVGDGSPAILGGASTTGNTQAGVSGLSDSGAGVQGTSASGQGLLGIITTSATAAPLEGRYTGTGVGITTLLKLRNSTTGTVVAGTGGQLTLLCASDTTAGRTQAGITSAWTDATDATRSSYLALSVSNAGAVVERVRIGPTGAVALRSTTLTNAAALYAQWVTGDALPTARFGASTSGNDQIAVMAVSDSGAGVTGTSTSGVGVQGQTGTGGAGVLGLLTGAGTAALEGRYTGSGTGAQPLLILRAATSGTGATATGGVLSFLAKSATVADRPQMDWTASWGGSPTDATRKARGVWQVYDTAAREILRGEASGTAPMIGFLGAAAVVRQTLTAASTDLTTVVALANSLRTALINLGLGV